MGDTRFKNGLALGPYANFFIRTDNLFSENDTTPDVTNGSLFYSNNTTATAISTFDLTVPGGGASSNASQFEGKVINVVFLDNLTSATRSTGLQTTDLQNTPFGANSVASFIYHNSAWVELYRSNNNPEVSSVLKTSVTGSTGLAVSGNTITIVHTATAANTSINSISGGYLGQLLTIINAGSSGITLKIRSDGNIKMSTAQLVLANTGDSARLVCVGTSPVTWATTGFWR